MKTNFKQAAEFLAAAENICDELYSNGGNYKNGVTVLKTGRRTIKNQRNYKVRKQIHWSVAHTRKYCNSNGQQEEYHSIVENDPLRAQAIIDENTDKAKGILFNMTLLKEYLAKRTIEKSNESN